MVKSVEVNDARGASRGGGGGGTPTKTTDCQTSSQSGGGERRNQWVVNSFEGKKGPRSTLN